MQNKLYLPFIFDIFLHKAFLFPNQVVKIRRIRHTHKKVVVALVTTLLLRRE